MIPAEKPGANLARAPRMAPLETALAAVAVSCAVANVAIYFRFLPAAVISVPYWDQLHWMYGFYGRKDLLSFVWEQYGDHRNVFSKLLEAADLILTKGSIWDIAAVQQAFWAALCGTVIAKTAFAAQMRTMRFWTAVPLCALSFFCANYVYTAYPINVSFLFVTGFAFLAFAACCSESRLFLATPLLVFLSHISSANGLLVWPIVLLLTWLRRGFSRHLWYLTATMALLLAAYFIGYSSGNGGVHAAGGGLKQAALFFLDTQGLPWSLAPRMTMVGLAAGVVLTVCEAIVITHFVVRRPGATPQRVAAACVLFALATCLIIAWNRYDLVPRVGGRYLVFPHMAVMGMIVYCLPWIAEHWEHAARRRTLQVAVCATLALMLPIQLSFAKYYAARSADFTVRAKAIAAGQRDSLIVSPIYSEPADLDTLYRIMKDKGIYLYRR